MDKLAIQITAAYKFIHNSSRIIFQQNSNIVWLGVLTEKINSQDSHHITYSSCFAGDIKKLLENAMYKFWLFNVLCLQISLHWRPSSSNWLAVDAGNFQPQITFLSEL